MKNKTSLFQIKHHRLQYVVMCLLFLICFEKVNAQSSEVDCSHQPFVRFNATDICAGTTDTLSIGYDTTNNIVIKSNVVSLSVVDTVFLPDGVYCEPHGCSYRSSVNFSHFTQNAQITSVEDIHYLRAKLEHSYAADLYINLTCPNGQKADILRFGGVSSATSDCLASIPDSVKGWSTAYSNAGTGTFFGNAYDLENGNYPCDGTRINNEPGVGWNYCWSNNTTQNFNYAPLDGIIYRYLNILRVDSSWYMPPSGSGSWSYKSIFDSSDVANKTNFYHPDESFAKLIGCPMNGEWSIEVMDGWLFDNGYIFEWELALSPNVHTQHIFVLDTFNLSGPWVNPVDTSHFSITAPNNWTGDNTITYTITIIDTAGCEYDSTFQVSFWPTFTQLHQDTTCIGQPYLNYGFNYLDTIRRETVYDTLLTLSLTSIHGCDSIIQVQLTVWPKEYTEFSRATCDTYTWNRVTYDETGDYQQTFTNRHGCDSIVTLHFSVIPPLRTYNSIDICRSSLPYQIPGTRHTIYPGAVSYDIVDTLTSLVTGCDSISTLYVNIMESQHTTISDSACNSYYWHDRDIDQPGDHYFSYLNEHGCICSDTLHLTLFQSTHNVIYDTICKEHRWHDHLYTESGIYTYSYNNEHGCASVDTLHLTIVPVEDISIISHQTDCSDTLVMLSLSHDVSSCLWSNGATTDSTLVSSPGVHSVITTDNNGCHAYDTISLNWMENPFIGLNIPDMCAGNTYPLTIGYDINSNIQLHSDVSSQGVSDTIFLPDGIYCEPFGCSYRSPITFTNFYRNARIQDANDILYVRVNMEHSYAGDLYINITCPNGQKADILRYGGTGTSTCDSSIANTSRGWSNNPYGYNAGFQTYFGYANDYESSLYPCDASAYDNEPGVGWNYCWSNNTTQNISYGADDGIIYRNDNLAFVDSVWNWSSDSTTGWWSYTCVFDSSDVANKSQFYHPDESFASLVGCPMNGTWSIEVLDGWHVDNGYIFEWELSLSSELHTTNQFVMDTISVDGPWVTDIRNTVFNVTPPANLERDTTIAYVITLYDTTGCAFDTTIWINFWVPRDTLIQVELCAGSTLDFPGFNFSAPYSSVPSDTLLTNTFEDIHGCDSTVSLHISILPVDVISIVSHQTDCSDTTTMLSLSRQAYSYHWSTGATTDSVFVTVPGSYSITVTESNGCQAYDDIMLDVMDNPISDIYIPDMCAGNTYPITIGYDTTSNILLHTNVSSIAVSGRIFIPDGEYCEPYGCSYRSPITFTDFSTSAHIRDTNDIYYLRVNMEHSFSGDIYINLTCPNGQKSDILRYGGTGSSSCNGSIPASSRGWASGTNAQTGIYLGIANPTGSSLDKCDSSAFPAGIGWNYCWSNNSNQGYTYAPGEGSLIYRYQNAHNGSLDSSDVANHTKFYHPDDSFSNLIGCPMNGTWYIEIIDGWGADNGYLFEWELSLSPELQPAHQFSLDTISVDGPWITEVNPSSFNITPPANIDHDTTIAYVVTLYDTTGCTIDTTIWVNVWANPDTLIQIELCAGGVLDFPGFNFTAPISSTPSDTLLTRIEESVHGCDSTIMLRISTFPTDSTEFTDDGCLSYTWNDSIYTQSGDYRQAFTDAHGCDSIVTLHLTIWPTEQTNFTDSACVSYTWNDSLYTQSGDYQQTFPNRHGCDSTVTLHLTIWPANHIDITDNACVSYTWHDSIYTQSGDYTQTFTNMHGCDSTVTLHLTIWPTEQTNFTVENCVSYTWNDSTYAQSGDYTQSFTNRHGCDSTVTLHLMIWPTEHTDFTDEACVSYTWNDSIYTQSGDYIQTLQTVHGCDSTVTLHLTIWPTEQTSFTDSACVSYTWNDSLYTQSGDYQQTFPNRHGCDSTVTLHLTIWPANHIDITDNACFSYTWHDSIYTQSGDYTQTFTNMHGCDSTVTLHLTISNGTHLVANEESCFSFNWHDSTFTQSGTYLFNYSDADGCNSTDTLHLTIYEGTHNVLYDTICRQYVWHDILYTESGTYTYYYSNEHGCSSTEELHLTILTAGDISIINHQTDCSDSLVTLSLTEGAVSCLWSTGATSDSVVVPAPGTYTVFATDSIGCTYTDTIMVTWRQHPVFALNIPDLCAGDTYPFTIGFDNSSNILLHTNVSSLEVNDTIFLPDGVYCDPYGCSYRSPVTFTDFSPNAHIQSVNDLYYLRIKMEHSYCGDIYINLTCPNGQKADILKYGGIGTSSCNNSIPTSSRGWETGNNASKGSDFGIANASGSSLDKCDRSAYPMGTGWNYCWSNNTSQGYTYAPGAGSLIYRSENAHNSRLDSSNVANHSKFYHPDESFASLIGCPMNGTWYIEIMDGWGADNGYIFGWELSLAPELQPYNLFSLDTINVDGPWVNNVSSSIFTITPPATLENDTTISYVITLYDPNGCAFDTTIWVNIWVQRDTLIETTLCAGSTLNFPGFSFTAPVSSIPTDTTLTRIIQTTHGCDSTIVLHISILPTFNVHDTLRLYSDELPYTLHQTVIPTTVAFTSSYNFQFTAINGCDSLVTTTVIITPPDTVRIDSTLCVYNMPLVWNGVTFTRDTSVAITIPSVNGHDSIVVMSVHVITNPIQNINVPNHSCVGDNINVSIGFRPTSTILLTEQASRHHEVQNIFLPDGMSCQPYGTYYRSHAIFNDFVPNTTIASANDILYLRLKMEHSAIEDLRITLVCPNGNSCKIIPDELYDGWSPVTHTYFRTNLGLANRHTDSLSCDSSLNPIGTPWNYIWSNNTSLGYQYAPGTYGYCYEAANTHLRSNPLWDNSNSTGLNSYVIDSSSLSNMTQIYHPLQSFSTLVGCPLNGDWYIQVQDLQEQDNGYLVEWELALSPSLLQLRSPAIVTRTLTGPWVVPTSDSTYVITPPTTLQHDTVVTYTITVFDSLGCTFDSTFDIHFHVPATVNVYDTIFQNQLPYNYGGHTFPTGSPLNRNYTFHLFTTFGCDSTVNYFLHIIPNDSAYVQRFVCQNELPYTWDGLTFTQAGTQIRTINAVLGSDSLIFMTLNVGALSHTELSDTLCQGEPYNNFGFVLPSDSTQSSRTFSRLLTNSVGCDSTVTLNLFIHPNTQGGTVTVEIPENQLPYIFLGETFTHDTTGVILHTANAAGCDSTLTFDLIVHHNSQTTIDTTLCDYELPLLWNGHMLSTSSVVTDTLHDQFSADSIVTLNLTIINTDIQIISHTAEFCDYNEAELEVISPMNNFLWSTGETSTNITVYSPGNYSVTGSQGECDAQAVISIASCDYEIYLPNAITPGKHDGLNDKFFLPHAYQPQIADQHFSITIVNRWGEIAFYSEDKHFSWDGTFKGELYHNVIYVYTIRYQNIFGKPSIIKGSITVL